MAWTQQRAGSYRILFRYHGKQHAFTLGQVSQDEADNKAAQVDYLLMRLKQGLVELPPEVDIVSFVEADGQMPLAVKTANRRETVTLGKLRDRYKAAHGDAQEENTLKTAAIHFKHLVTTLGEGFPLSELSHTHLQQHIDRRAAAGVKAVTTKKELGTFRAAWNWGRLHELTNADWPGRSGGLVFKKSAEKPPFQTRAEIERQIKTGSLRPEQKREFWQSLYLLKNETAEALEIIRKKARSTWVYPMACTAAYTGARRSELLRMRVSDVDLKNRFIVVREKKRVRGKLTTRRVPIAKKLATILKSYLAEHPGGNLLFCQAFAGSTPRTPSVKMVQWHLRRALAKSKWSVIRGWHIFRHSFVSACASQGVDQRLLQTWCGHMSAETSARYAHLYPSSQQSALDSVFG